MAGVESRMFDSNVSFGIWYDRLVSAPPFCFMLSVVQPVLRFCLFSMEEGTATRSTSS